MPPETNAESYEGARDVRRDGVVLDGLDDQAASLNKALAGDAPIVQFPKGTAGIAAPLLITSKQFIGRGRGSRIDALPGFPPGKAMLELSGDAIRIAGLGLWAGSGGRARHAEHIIATDPAGLDRLDLVSLYGAFTRGDGIKARNATWLSTGKLVRIDLAGGYAFNFDNISSSGGNTTLTFRNWYAAGPARGGWKLTSVSGMVAEGCAVDHCPPFQPGGVTPAWAITLDIGQVTFLGFYSEQTARIAWVGSGQSELTIKGGRLSKLGSAKYVVDRLFDVYGHLTVVENYIFDLLPFQKLGRVNATGKLTWKDNALNLNDFDADYVDGCQIETDRMVKRYRQSADAPGVTGDGTPHTVSIDARIAQEGYTARNNRRGQHVTRVPGWEEFSGTLVMHGITNHDSLLVEFVRTRGESETSIVKWRGNPAEMSDAVGYLALPIDVTLFNKKDDRTDLRVSVGGGASESVTVVGGAEGTGTGWTIARLP